MGSALDLLGSLVVDNDGSRWGDRATEVQWSDARALLDRDGPRQHWIGRPRGYSKTDDLAAVTLSVMLTQLQTGQEAIAVAASRDQARIVIDRIRNIVAWTPELGSSIQVSQYHVRAGHVSLEATAADGPAAYGRLPSWTIVDELGQWADSEGARDVWNAAITAFPKVRTGRLAIITTAGASSHWSRQVYDNALEDDLWRVSEVHSPAPWMSEADLASQRRSLPEGVYQRFFENRWTAAESTLLSLEDVRSCAVLPGSLEAQPGHNYVLGVDLAVKNDRTVVAVCHAERIDDVDDVAARRIVVDDLTVFAPSKHSHVDLDVVQGVVETRSRQYHHAPVMFDPAMAPQMIQGLKGKGLTVHEHQFSANSNSKRALMILELVRGHRLWIPDEEEVIEEFASVRLRETQPGVFRVDHTKGRHDDRVTAISLAALHLLEQPVHDYSGFIADRSGFMPDAPGVSKWDLGSANGDSQWCGGSGGWTVGGGRDWQP